MCMPTLKMQIVERGSGYLQSNVKSEVEKQLSHFNSPFKRRGRVGSVGEGYIAKKKKKKSYKLSHSTYRSLIAKMARFCWVS